MLSDNKKTSICFGDLPQEIKNVLIDKNTSQNLSKDFASHTLKQAKEIFEKKYIEHQLVKFDNNITKVSDFIGMERTALYRKIKNLKINLEKEK